MKTKHTPGPWTTEETTVYSGPCPIAECDTTDGDAYNENVANARLIAAAPDLLEAAHEIAALADGQGYLNLTMVAGHAKQIIAKATQ